MDEFIRRVVFQRIVSRKWQPGYIPVIIALGDWCNNDLIEKLVSRGKQRTVRPGFQGFQTCVGGAALGILRANIWRNAH